ncbi:hypothetical protein ACVGOW_12815 [Pseudonocardia saturnea]
MDLTGWVLARAAPRPLLVAVPGGRGVRLAVERVIRERGWDQASAPAEADLFVVCGSPGPALVEEVERVWSQLPSPRARIDISAADTVVDGLDRARARLAEPENRLSDTGRGAASADGEADAAAAVGDHTAPDDMHGSHDMREESQRGGQYVHGGHDMHGSHDEPRGGDHDMHGGADESQDGGHEMHGGHDMHMMHGGEVAGLPMADRAPDRDGLTLDVLHVRLGPILADWPAGLVVRVTLQGDAVQSAQVEVVGEPGSPWDGPPAAAALDSMARLLVVCGASTAARTAGRLRDEILAGVVDDAELRRFTRRLRRSRTLSWATDGIGRLDDSRGELAGDATDRWRRWLDVADGAPAGDDADRRARVAVEVMPGLLEGLELAAARVLVASLDPDLDTLVASREAAP